MSPKVDGSVPAALPPASCQAIIYRDLPGGIPPRPAARLGGMSAAKPCVVFPGRRGGESAICGGGKVSWGHMYSVWACMAHY